MNTVEISGAGLTTPIEVTNTVTVTEEARLSITKSLCPETVAENGQLTYTFTIQNIGNIAAVATFTQDAITGQWNIVPGVAILSVTGTV